MQESNEKIEDLQILWLRNMNNLVEEDQSPDLWLKSMKHLAEHIPVSQILWLGHIETALKLSEFA